MRATWFRFVFWFFFTFVAVSVLFFGAIYMLVRPALDAGAATQQTGWDLSPESGVKILGLYGLVIAIAFAVAGWLVVRKTFTPIVSLNDQLSAIEPNNLQVRVQVETEDSELKELQEHINGLLSRISLSFHQLQSYSAQVAHELRAPLTIIRLKIEEAADKIEPALAEEIQTELLRLTMHVEQALLIARAEQGHLRPNPMRFDLAELLEDVAQDFRLLARDEGRQIEVAAKKSPISADPKYLKQMLYSLLTNSLRHGRGTIHATLQPGPQLTVLSIKNQVKAEDSDETLDLGLGRRIVAALAALQQNMEIQTERKEGWYEVTLSIRDGEPKEKTEPQMNADLRR
ncbi:MAG TPA: HAMP domain-containing sensor histidine kinase [Chthoniobacterales bacterium]|nr:HAMP domain-containing sensor histidine kinase [Chthoniobacterales bacterium]